MIENLAEQITLFLIEKKDMPKEREALCRYAFEILISNGIFGIALIIIGCASGSMMLLIIFILFFLPVRMLGGGYHATGHCKCLLLSIAICLTVPPVCHFAGSRLQLCMVLSICFVITALLLIARFAPVIHVNNSVPAKQAARARRYCLALTVMHGIIVIGGILMMPTNAELFLAGSYGSFIAGFSLLFAKLNQKEGGTRYVQND